MEVISHLDDHFEKFNKAVDMALRVVGGQGERIAKETITDMDAIDTGLLRNSITFALGGGTANIGSYSSDSGAVTGSYDGKMGDDNAGERTVYIGTNVYYAPYVHYGTYKMQARPFLSQGIIGSQQELAQLFKDAFSAFL